MPYRECLYKLPGLPYFMDFLTYPGYFKMKAFGLTRFSMNCNLYLNDLLVFLHEDMVYNDADDIHKNPKYTKIKNQQLCIKRTRRTKY